MKNSKKLSVFNLSLPITLLTFLSYIFGIYLENKFILPFLNSFFSYPLMLYLVSKGMRRKAVHLMMVWAFSMIILGTLSFSLFPEKCEKIIINGIEYREEMFEWIKTGTGRESDPSQFIPQHLIHISIFTFLSILSASFLSILMGAIMVNYMNFYVSQLILLSKNKLIPIILGWHFWAIIRVMSFVILGVFLSEPIISILKKRRIQWKKDFKLFLFAISGLIGDIVLKTIFAPIIRTLLKNSLF